MEIRDSYGYRDNINYGIIGNCQSSALIYKDSSIDWCCFPKFDSPSIFAKIIDNSMDVKGFIFDGFPRTTTQAEALDKLLDEKCIPIKIMLSLKVDDEELIKRLMKRGLESGRADDQNQKIIENRINEYNKKTSPLKDYFKLQEKLEEIAGMGSIEEISKKIHSALDKI